MSPSQMSASKANMAAPLSPRFTKLGVVNEDINAMTQSFASGQGPKRKFSKPEQFSDQGVMT